MDMEDTRNLVDEYKGMTNEQVFDELTKIKEENIKAKKLYSKFGFIENGEKDDEELVAVLKL